MSVIDKIKLDGTTYDVGKTPDTTLAVSGSPADAAKVGTELDKKVDKVVGKGLSTEDFTTVEKTKLAGIAEGATNIVIDPTLTQAGQAADAKVVGSDLGQLSINSYQKTNGSIVSAGNWNYCTNDGYKHVAIPVSAGDTITVKGGTATGYMSFLKAYSTPSNGVAVSFSDTTDYTSRKTISANTSYDFVVPNDTNYVVIQVLLNSADVTPVIFNINGYNILKSVSDNIVAITNKVDDALSGLPEINVDNVFDKKPLNLFDGNYLNGVSLNGSTSFTFAANASANSLAVVPVESGKQYSVIVADGGPETNGYYYLKIASVHLDAPIQSATELIGVSNNYLIAQTSGYLKNYTATIPSGDNYLVVQASLTKQPFLQIVEGEQSDFSADTYAAQYGYFPSDNTEVYSKTEVNSLLEKTTYSIDGNIMTIRMGKAEYKFQRITNNSINIDTWRLYQGAIVENGTSYVMWVNSDAEGAIQITGEEDFVSGYHGDEIMNSIHVFVDGAEIDLTTSVSDALFKNMTVYVESDVYHCNTSASASNKAFKRYKKLTFKENTVKISNCYIAQEALSIAQARIALFQCYKAPDSIDFFTDYSVNTDYKHYAVSEIATVKPASSDRMTEADLHTVFATIVFKYLFGSDQSYMGSVVNFASQNRVKFYFDTINSETQVSQGEKIMSEFEFTIIP